MKWELYLSDLLVMIDLVEDDVQVVFTSREIMETFFGKRPWIVNDVHFEAFVKSWVHHLAKCFIWMKGVQYE